jgi:site-specific recombinase XerD
MATVSTVFKMPGRRRKPWVARITTGWKKTIVKRGKNKGKEVPRQTYQIIGYFETKQEGIDALAMHRIDPVSPKTNITLDELYKEWSEAKYESGISRDTVNNYKAAWKHVDRLKNAKLKDLRTAHWQKVIDEKRGVLGHSSLKKIKSLATMLYNYALKNDIAKKNYAEFIELPRHSKQEKQIFSDLDIQKMLKNADTVPWVDTVLIMIFTGMRISEMLQLTKFNVDLEKQIITGGIKTEAGKDRLIPINIKILPYIKKWYKKNGQALICRDDGSPIPVKYYREKFYYPALEALEVQKLTPHACRHTFASLMAAANVDPLHIQKIIGHTDYAFTANEYTHPEIKELKKAINKI